MDENYIPDPLTAEDLPYLPDLDDLSRPELTILLERLTTLYNELDAEEPDWSDVEDELENEAHDEWIEQLEEIDDLMDDIRDRLDEEA